ncbi:MAG: class I SAM-dependent methyltransferase [Chloroflexi bacterium]|nr:class I SAM-dependent methyltransferase [Chloroflexota bacterium]
MKEVQVWEKHWSEHGAAVFTPLSYAQLHWLRLLEGHVKPGHLVLEAGAGSATVSLMLTHKLPIKLTLLDFAQAACLMIKKGSGSGGASPYIVQGDVRATPFKDAAFDLVWSAGVLEHFPQPEKVLQEFHRLLRPGGKVVSVVPGKYSLWGVYQRYHQWRHGHWKHGYERQVTVSELRGTHEKAGFRVLSAHTLPSMYLAEYLERGTTLLKRALNPLGKILRRVGPDPLRALLGYDVVVVGQKEGAP